MEKPWNQWKYKLQVIENVLEIKQYEISGAKSIGFMLYIWVGDVYQHKLATGRTVTMSLKGNSNIISTFKR